MHLTKNLKLDFLGFIPRFEDEFLDSQSIIAFSALLSFKGKPIKWLYQEAINASCHPERSEGSKKKKILKQVQDDFIKKKVSAILRHSSLRGHASLSTTPALAITFQGSKFLDSMLTGTVFSSSLMASGRRTETLLSDIVYPSSIYNSRRVRFLYQKQMKENINFLNKMLKAGVPQDEASKIMPYGIVGTGIVVLPIESLVGFGQELELQKDWMPEDGYLFIDKVKKKLAKFGLDELYYTRKVAPRNVYPYPNIFKDPKVPNLARDLGVKLGPGQLSALVGFESLVTPKLLKQLKLLKRLIKSKTSSKRKIKNQWYKNLLKRKEICRDYNPSVSLSVVSSVSWRVWGEKKRHRTVPQVVDSIYASVDRALAVFKKAYPKIQRAKVEDKLLKEIDFVFSVPPTIAKDKKNLAGYLKTAAKSLFTYQKLIQQGIAPRDAIYVVPRGIRIYVFQKFDLYNLITGYYPLRLCQTAEEQMRRMTEEEWVMLKRLLTKRGLSDILSLVAPKCHLVGFCPEQKFCGKIKALVPFYDQDFHQEMKKELEKRFLESKGGGG